jgi:hypothetical protein
MSSMLTWTARGLWRTAASIVTPCSVKAYGGYRRPPRLASSVSWNMSSPGVDTRKTISRRVFDLPGFAPAAAGCHEGRKDGAIADPTTVSTEDRV